MSASKMQKLAVATTVTPPPCTTPSDLVLSNIDFGQQGWLGDKTPGDPVAVATPLRVSLTFTDSDPAAVHTVQWFWGDGTSSPAGTSALVEDNGSGSASETHSYSTAGVYTISAVVADDCDSRSVERQLVVYDPSAGFVTGGGWIQSPAGAFPADPSLAGRANFGFVSKYLKGATAPSGATEFQFQTGKLNFHSGSYDWLVVAGARAQYQGTGSINGQGGYRFFLTAVDGDSLGGGTGGDRFRIRIWHADAVGSDVLDYDNQIDASQAGGTSEGTAIGGGSIVIHK